MDFPDALTGSVLAAGQGAPLLISVPSCVWPSSADFLRNRGVTAVTLVGDTGCGKTQWALQVASHAAAAGVPVCYVAPEAGVDQVAPRLLSIKAGHRWNELYVGKTNAATIDSIRASFSAELKKLPFHLLPGRASRPGEPGSLAVAEWMREKYRRPGPGRRPLLIVQDFVELVSGVGRDQEEFNLLKPLLLIVAVGFTTVVTTAALKPVVGEVAAAWISLPVVAALLIFLLMKFCGATFGRAALITGLFFAFQFAWTLLVML